MFSHKGGNAGAERESDFLKAPAGFFFFLAAPQLMEFLGQEPDPGHIFDLHCSCGNAGVEPASWRPEMLLMPLHHSGNSRKQLFKLAWYELELSLDSRSTTPLLFERKLTIVTPI